MICNCRGLVFEECVFQGNGGYGVQLGGTDVDLLSFTKCGFVDNAAGPGAPPGASARVEFLNCTVTAKGRKQK